VRVGHALLHGAEHPASPGPARRGRLGAGCATPPGCALNQTSSTWYHSLMHPGETSLSAPSPTQWARPSRRPATPLGLRNDLARGRTHGSRAHRVGGRERRAPRASAPSPRSSATEGRARGAPVAVQAHPLPSSFLGAGATSAQAARPTPRTIPTTSTIPGVRIPQARPRKDRASRRDVQQAKLARASSLNRMPAASRQGAAGTCCCSGDWPPREIPLWNMRQPWSTQGARVVWERMLSILQHHTCPPPRIPTPTPLE
jgi:hypothetical protein